MRKFTGVFLCAIGTIVAVISAIMFGAKLYQVFPYGFFGQDVTVLRVLSIIFAASLLVVLLGRRLLRKPVERDAYTDDMAAEKYEVPFAEQERAKEMKAVEAQAFVPTSGAYIWKYKGKTSGNRGYALAIGLKFIAIIAGVVVFIIGMVYASAAIGRTETMMWMETAMIFVMTAVVVVLAMRLGGTSSSQLYAFARDDKGRLYLFNYHDPVFNRYGNQKNTWVIGTSLVGGIVGIMSYFIGNVSIEKRMRRIDEEQVIERIMTSGHVYPYGKRIVEVKSIRPTVAGARRIYCTLRLGNGALQHTSIVLSQSYQNFDSLLKNMEKLK